MNGEKKRRDLTPSELAQVAEVLPKENPRTVIGKPKKKFVWQKFLLPAASIAILIILVAGAAIYHKQQSSDGCNGNSKSKTYFQAAKALDNPMSIQSATTYNEVVGDKKYDQDPNCLYFSIRFNMLNGNQKDAKTAFTKYKKVYKPNNILDFLKKNMSDDPVIIVIELQKMEDLN